MARIMAQALRAHDSRRGSTFLVPAVDRFHSAIVFAPPARRADPQRCDEPRERQSFIHNRGLSIRRFPCV